jgi:hypothetical protein
MTHMHDGPGALAGAAGADQDIAQQRPDNPTTSTGVVPSPGGGDGELLADRPAPSDAAPSPGSPDEATAEIARLAALPLPECESDPGTHTATHAARQR